MPTTSPPNRLYARRPIRRAIAVAFVALVGAKRGKAFSTLHSSKSHRPAMPLQASSNNDPHQSVESDRVPTTSHRQQEDSDLDATKISFDSGAFEKKNALRKKFGLKAITPVEFDVIQSQVRELEIAQRRKADLHKSAAASAVAAAEVTERHNKRGNRMGKILGAFFDDGCESNWDCDRPQVCCDLGFKKMCCASGQHVLQYQPVLIPVPVESGIGPMASDAL